MMKIEIEKDFPQYFKPAYPEEFELFSHFEVTAGIPTVLFAVTTWKENGKPNVCFHSWSCFHGDKTAFFAVMGNLYQHTHTYVILCAVSVILNIKLFSTKYKTPIVGKIGLLSATLCFGLFTYFAFLMPQNGLPAALFS